MFNAKYVINTAKIERKQNKQVVTIYRYHTYIFDLYISFEQVYVTVYFSVRCVGWITVLVSRKSPYQFYDLNICC